MLHDVDIPSRPRSLRSVPTFRWHPPAVDSADIYGLTAEQVEQVARHPQAVLVDPTTVGRGALTERRTRGDVTVIVRYDEGLEPVILGVYLRLPLDVSYRASAPGAGGGGRAAPNTMRALRRAVVEAGCTIKPGGVHDKVLSPDGRFLTSLPRTPSDYRSIPNAVAQLRRKGVDI